MGGIDSRCPRRNVAPKRVHDPADSGISRRLSSAGGEKFHRKLRLRIWVDFPSFQATLLGQRCGRFGA